MLSFLSLRSILDHYCRGRFCSCRPDVQYGSSRSSPRVCSTLAVFIPNRVPESDTTSSVRPGASTSIWRTSEPNDQSCRDFHYNIIHQHYSVRDIRSPRIYTMTEPDSQDCPILAFRCKQHAHSFTACNISCSRRCSLPECNTGTRECL